MLTYIEKHTRVHEKELRVLQLPRILPIIISLAPSVKETLLVTPSPLKTVTPLSISDFLFRNKDCESLRNTSAP